MYLKMDFKQICRLCLASNKQTFDIFSSYYAKRNVLYSEMIWNCTTLKPQLGDGLPHIICKDCSRQLKRVYVFHLQCEESDIKLRNYLEANLNIKHEEDNGTVMCEELSILNFENENKDLVPIFNGNITEHEIEIKAEPNLNDDDKDSCWDAEDDNVFLGEIKSKKDLNGVDIVYNEEKPRRKRGRKKRVFVDGEFRGLPESKTPHQCDVCGKFLSTRSNLKAHKICHTDLRPYKCGDCPATFRGHSALFQHRKIHTGETPYHCEYCPKQFKRRTGLINHIRMHKEEKIFSCDICFKKFVQSGQLSIHMKRHKGDKPFLCQDCGKGFPLRSDLKVHQRIHNGEKPYSCHLCTKTFATSGNLSIHIRIHKKEVRYHCKVCQRGFVTCSAYNVHLKRHKGQRDYHCECGKTFYTSSALKQHKVVHTGEKRYQCLVCERKFTQTSHLSRHFKRDHAKPNVPIPSSKQYKRVLNENNVQEKEETYLKIDIQKMAVNEDVKWNVS